MSVAVPIPKSILGLDDNLFDGIFNVWFFTSDTMPVIKSPIEIPLLPRKVTILSSVSDAGRWGLQIKIEQRPDGSTQEGGIAANVIITGLVAAGVLFAGYLTFDKIEAVLDDNQVTFGLFGIAAVLIGIYFVIKIWKQST